MAPNSYVFLCFGYFSYFPEEGLGRPKPIFFSKNSAIFGPEARNLFCSRPTGSQTCIETSFPDPPLQPPPNKQSWTSQRPKLIVWKVHKIYGDFWLNGLLKWTDYDVVRQVDKQRGRDIDIQGVENGPTKITMFMGLTWKEPPAPPKWVFFC